MADHTREEAEKMADQVRKAATAEEEDAKGFRAQFFFALCYLELMANFDAGVLPATVTHLMVEFELDYTEGGLLGALVYLGLTVGAPLSGYFLTNVKSQRKLLICSALANSLAVGLNAAAWNTPVLFLSRFLIGFTQAPIIVYLPVWVDEFSPEGSEAIWMAAIQAAVAIGIMFGYVTGGLLVTYTGTDTCVDLKPDHTPGGLDAGLDNVETLHACYSSMWRVPLLIQAISVFIYIPVLLFVPGRHVNAKGGVEGRIVYRAKKMLARKLVAARLPGLGELKSQVQEAHPEDDAAEILQMQLQKHFHQTATDKLLAKHVGKALGTVSDQTLDAAATDIVPQKASVEHHVTHVMAHDTFAGLFEAFEHHETDGTEDEQGGQLKQIVYNKLFLSLTLALSGLYFVVTGIQFWITDYLTTPRAEGGIGADAGTVVLCFSLSSLTGPTAGVFFGGWYIDKYAGGYSNAQGTLGRCCFFGAAATLFAFPAAFTDNMWVIQGSLWWLLFFGGALLSPATGVCINAVSPELRAFSSALSMFAYNIFGYAAAPFLCGVLAQHAGLRVGFRTVLLTTTVAWLGLVLAWRASISAEADQIMTRSDSIDMGSSKSRFANPMDDENDKASVDEENQTEVSSDTTVTASTTAPRQTSPGSNTAKARRLERQLSTPGGGSVDLPVGAKAKRLVRQLSSAGSTDSGSPRSGRKNGLSQRLSSDMQQ